MIVKVQTPIMPPDAPVLVYNKDRSHQGQLSMDELPVHVKQAVAKARKAYFRATMVGTKISFGPQVSAPDW